jgi:ubiquinone/menaquinone biosynthesis C-methylase UbiE
MIAQARSSTPSANDARIRFDLTDAAALPYGAGEFDLVTLANMIPFFDELARVITPGGAVVFSFSAGPETPIYVAPERLRSELERRGFTDFAEFSAGRGTSLLARKRT